MDREFRPWPEPTLNLAKKGSSVTPSAGSLPPNAGCSAQTCLCPCCPLVCALHFPATLLGSIRCFQVALKGLWEAVPGIPRLRGKLRPQCLIPGAPTTSTVTGPVAELSLCLYPLAFLPDACRSSPGFFLQGAASFLSLFLFPPQCPWRCFQRAHPIWFAHCSSPGL